jgi:hypothetical protein
MATAIPGIYRFLFTWYDPLVVGLGVYLALFNRDAFINSFIPNTQRNPAHDYLFYQLTGYMLYLAIIGVVLLRYTSDIGVWKITMGAVMVIDATLFIGVYPSLQAQGRLSPSTWRFEEWASFGFTAFSFCNKLLFVAGVGLKPAPEDVRRKRL